MATKVDDPVITQSMLDKSLESFGRTLSKQIVDEVGGIIADFAERVDARFNRLEERVDKLEEGQARLIDTLDRFLKRLDDIEADNTARDTQLARLERWIEQVARKTGVKLEY